MSEEPRLLGGRYEIGETVGYGGMAEVHRGRDRRLGREVAIKLLRSDLANDETFLVRFRREAQNSASLNHPNIVAVFDTGEENGIPYMVMEYVDGRTLKEFLLADGRFEPNRACEVLADVCSALDFSHKHHIIHRDVKPGNVMVTSTGQVKVMDFGIARALASGQSTMTQTSAVIGTAQYLSPEQARGETVDARSDVYSTGCVLYEMLIGHPPFTGDSPVSVAYQHVKEDPTPPSELNPSVPPAVDAVVMKALAKNPDNRYQSAGEMREDLLRAVRGGDVTAPMVMPASMGADGGAGESTEPIAPIETRKSRKRGPLIALLLILSLLLLGLIIWGLWAFTGDSEEMVRVPDVTGDSEEVATETLEADGFEVTKDSETAEDPDNEDIGTVIEQDPSGGGQEAKGSEVTITILQAPGQVRVPDVLGDDYETAAQTLRDSGFSVKKEVDSDSTADFDEVIDQSPDGGDQADKGSEVVLTVSEGSQATVPNAVGMGEDRARSEIEGAGFEFQAEYVDEGTPGGVSVDQDPDDGSTAPRGSVVTVYFPGVAVNYTLEETTLEEFRTIEGIEVQCDGEGCDDPSKTLKSVDVESGDVVKQGTTVVVTVEESTGDGDGDGDGGDGDGGDGGEDGDVPEIP
ncbi:Stk1 family PASTA domain-containing Ser/Thr kinase [Haloglycomyces albus]|uniref:Stk1 family PASTA domain-containing Ser/Thr kinase n=1 Tax=Haloglycomyces albus TaxID=526067 RepID=UPI00046C9EE1|nr:Stk1 family PASTA domain-containing Ser/Thr kinase [Haloglycomyces albus]